MIVPFIPLMPELWLLLLVFPIRPSMLNLIFSDCDSDGMFVRLLLLKSMRPTRHRTAFAWLFLPFDPTKFSCPEAGGSGERKWKTILIKDRSLMEWREGKWDVRGCEKKDVEQKRRGQKKKKWWCKWLLFSPSLVATTCLLFPSCYSWLSDHSSLPNVT